MLAQTNSTPDEHICSLAAYMHVHMHVYAPVNVNVNNLLAISILCLHTLTIRSTPSSMSSMIIQYTITLLFISNLFQSHSISHSQMRHTYVLGTVARNWICRQQVGALIVSPQCWHVHIQTHISAKLLLQWVACGILRWYAVTCVLMGVECWLM